MDSFAKDLDRLGWPPVLLYKIWFVLTTFIQFGLVLVTSSYPWPTTFVISAGLSVLVVMATVGLDWQIRSVLGPKVKRVYLWVSEG